jgi:hypothetical protein
MSKNKCIQSLLDTLRRKLVESADAGKSFSSDLVARSEALQTVTLTRN